MEELSNKDVLYVSYKQMPSGQMPHITLIGPDSANLVEQFSKGKGLHVARIHTASPKPHEPDIEIVCVTNEKLPASDVSSVNQDVVNWLMQMGHIPFRG